MRVLLALPPDLHNLEIYRVAGIRAPPLGLAYIASVLEYKGHKVKIVDSPTLKISTKEFIDIVREFKPEVIGFSIQTPFAPKAYSIAKLIKSLDPSIITIAGGPHPTFLYEEALSNHIDIVVRGEGEKTIDELIDVLETHGLDYERLKNVKGIAFKYRDRIVVTPKRDYILNLDLLPKPARHLLPMDKYTLFKKPIRVVHVVASRGCPYGCIFCSTSYFWGRCKRWRTAKSVADEIEEAVDKYKVRHVAFVDDELIENRKFIYELVEEVKKRGLDLTFSCGARIDHVDREYMKYLYTNNFVALYFGVESASQETLNKIKKGITVDQVNKVFEWSKEIGLFAVASFIIGFPWEDESDIRKTIDFALKLNPNYAQFTVATPYPGTPLFEYAVEEGLIEDWNWEHYTTLRPVMRTYKLTLSKLRRLLREAYMKFYLRWSFIFRELKSGRILDLLPKLLEEIFKAFIERMGLK